MTERSSAARQNTGPLGPVAVLAALLLVVAAPLMRGGNPGHRASACAGTSKAHDVVDAKLPCHLDCAVGGAVIDDDDRRRWIVLPQRVDNSADVVALVEGRDDEKQTLGHALPRV